MGSERYLAEICSSIGVCPQLEQNDMKMLHVSGSVGGWREWGILTYNHNVLGELLLKENEILKNKIEEMEKKLNLMQSPSIPPPSI